MQTQASIKFPHRMLSRLLASHILLVSLPLLLTGLILIQTAQSSIEETILSRNLEMVRRSAEQIELTISKIYDILRLTAESPAINEMKRFSQRFTINKVVYEFEIIKRLQVASIEGSVLASTAFADTEKTVIAEKLNEPLLSLVRSGQRYSSEVYLSNENLPIMDVVQPIILRGETVGMLWAEVDLKAIWALVDRNVVGSPGSEAFIIRNDGQFIAHTDRRKVLQGEYFNETQILSAIANGDSKSLSYTGQDGRELIVAFAQIPSKRWGVVIQQPTAEAFAAARRMQIQILFIMLGSVMLAALIAFFYSRHFLRPVDRLILGINRIARGDLHYRIEPLGTDEISRLAEHFNQMAERLRNIQNQLKRTERLDTLGKLASVLSHEIRNPLNSMVINMQILQREYSKKTPDREKLDHYLKIVVDEIKRVDDLVNNFLIIARPPKLEQEVHNIPEIIDEVITVQQPLVLPKGIRIKRAYESDTLLARVDRNKLKQVFLNIFLNAVQAMPGGGRLSITVASVPPDITDTSQEMLRIVFADTGKGIKPEDLSQVFDFYYSTKKEGTGIGLSLAQQIIEEHGGRIAIRSEVDKGTEVEIYLPKYHEKAEAHEARQIRTSQGA